MLRSRVFLTVFITAAILQLNASREAFEEAAQLSEEELRERVKRSIEELVPISVSGSSEDRH